MSSRNYMPALHKVLPATLLMFAIALLSACATRPPSPEPVSMRTQQETVLRDLGFVEIEDGWLMTIAEPISFEFDRAELRDALRAELIETANKLLRVQVAQIRCEGHTDNLGSRDYNLALSLARGSAVANVFIEAGFPPDRVSAVGHASDYPVESNDSREGRAANRRVSIIIPAQSLAMD